MSLYAVRQKTFLSELKWSELIELGWWDDFQVPLFILFYVPQHKLWHTVRKMV